MILTDVDGVLLDWFGGFRSFLTHKGIHTDGPRPRSWAMTEWVKADNIQELIQEFNSSDAFMYLSHYVTALSVLRKLHMQHGHEIVAVTSCSSEPRVQAMRRRNLENKYGPIFKDIICLDLMETKTEVLKRYPAAFWVEDAIHGAKAGVEAGHKTFLINKSYNQEEVPGVQRVDGWYQIYDSILNSPRS